MGNTLVNASPCHQKKERKKKSRKTDQKKDEVSWKIVTIYLRAEMKKSGVNSGWLIPGKSSSDTNSTVCALHAMSMFLTSQLTHCAVAANETRSALWQQYATILILSGCRREDSILHWVSILSLGWCEELQGGAEQFWGTQFKAKRDVYVHWLPPNTGIYILQYRDLFSTHKFGLQPSHSQYSHLESRIFDGQNRNWYYFLKHKSGLYMKIMLHWYLPSHNFHLKGIWYRTTRMLSNQIIILFLCWCI